MSDISTVEPIEYDLGNGKEYLVFIPICPECGLEVIMDDILKWNDELGLKLQENAICKIHGRIMIHPEGIFDKEHNILHNT